MATKRSTKGGRPRKRAATFYQNRAGRNLPASRRRKIAKAKQELRRLFGKEH
ncbi:MAG TPA: DUF3175 domain-containing protein [Myxococcales bacterium]|nr:DUF3175 domain-containing protein [Myxococcales bacterium]